MSLLCGCGSSESDKPVVDLSTIVVYDSTNSDKGERDNTPVVYIPTHPEEVVYQNELILLDATNASEGYIFVKYSGESSKVKLQIACPNTATYTYRLSDNFEILPLTTGSGIYHISVYENVQDTQYSTIFTQDIEVEITNEYGPYLYPNQYVYFEPTSEVVTKGADLAYFAKDDLDVVTNVYNYVITNITYDTELANTVQSGYLPNPDNTLLTKKGICLDYSSLMASMLRSQGIPTHMEVGYAGNAYHAWISVYLSEIGWVNGIIEFNGTDWELMDPTFASSSSEDNLRNFIGDGTSYETKYVY